MKANGREPRNPGKDGAALQRQSEPSTPRRRLKPRAPIALQAAFVSQLNCLPLLGVNDRRFLDAVVPKCVGHVTALGKLRLVPVDIAIEKLQQLAVDADEPAIESGDDDSGDQPTSASEVLSRWGREVAP